MSHDHEHSNETLKGSYEQLYDEAENKIEIRDYDGAIEIFERLRKRLGKLSEKSFKRRPTLKELAETAAFQLGHLYVARGRAEEGVALMEAALLPRLDDGTDEEAGALYSMVVKIKGRLQNDSQVVKDWLMSQVTLHGNTSRPWIDLAFFAMDEDDYELADKALAHAKDKFDPASEDGGFGYYLAAFAYYSDTRNFDEMEHAWRELNKTSDKIDYTMLYHAYMEANEFELARGWLKKEKNPVLADYYRGRIAEAAGDETEMMAAWRRVAELPLEEIEFGVGHWAEAALRSGVHLPSDVLPVLASWFESGSSMESDVVVLAAAALMNGYPEEAHDELTDYLNFRKYRLINENVKLPAYGWDRFRKIVNNPQLTDPFRQYFTEETKEAQ